MSREEYSQICAVQEGDMRVEYRPPDLGLAYSVLAPIVSEAWAFMQCGQPLKAKQALKRAMKVIDMAGVTSVTLTNPKSVDAMESKSVDAMESK